ncbi:MAG: phosphomannomutase [Candidatus Parcubacteria bacterium]|nr:MAG: phosphomannomutase [Candidatus Parcubacteria bacterium]
MNNQKSVQINNNIFRRYDIRGVYGKDFNEDTFFQLGYAIAKQNERITVGSDNRRHSRQLAKYLIKGLSAKKAKVFYTDISSIGLCVFTGWQLKSNKIIFITASHLEPHWNGLKIHYGDGEPFKSKDIKNIKQAIKKLKNKQLIAPKQKQSIVKVNFSQKYINFFKKHFPLLKNNNLKIVVDCADGATSIIAPLVFKKLGFWVKKIHCNYKIFGKRRASEPTLEATTKLKKIVQQTKAHFGVAFDGDGDRAIIIDDQGRYLNGNEIGSLLAKFLINEHQQTQQKLIIVKTVAVSMALENNLKIQKNINIKEVPVGHNSVIPACKKYKAILGVEQSSHIVMPQYFIFDDALLVPLKIGEILIKEKKPLSMLINDLKTYPYKEITWYYDDNKKNQFVKTITSFAKKLFKKFKIIDGIKIYFPYGWFLIRQSNTSPNIKAYLEAINKSKLKLIEKKMMALIKKVRGRGLEPPRE